jgi:hypothetical protein
MYKEMIKKVATASRSEPHTTIPRRHPPADLTEGALGGRCGVAATILRVGGLFGM